MRIKQYFTSDWHIGHANVIKFSNRPFNNIDDMHRALVKRYNACVRAKDICWFLGDVGMGNVETVKGVLNQLNGKKILILGNHDRGVNSMYQHGFDAVMYGASLIIAGQVVTLSHCPLLGLRREDTHDLNPIENWHGELRESTQKYTVMNNNQFHLHGHLHAPNSGRSKVKLNRQYDVGVDGNNFSPVSIGMVESWIVKQLRDEKLSQAFAELNPRSKFLDRSV